MSAAQTTCDMCDVAPGEDHPDIPLRFCAECLPQFEQERRTLTLGWLPKVGQLPGGTAPKLTAFRLGMLAGLFLNERGRAKLERIAEAL
jgi:hypothetical protein